MPDKRTHRGPGPEDEKIFSAEKVGSLRSGVEDHSLLLTRGYSDKSALKLVGDKFSLTKRQRLAVMRGSCSDEQLFIRTQREIGIDEVGGGDIAIDGYNLLITIEAAMSGGVIFECRDGCFRDLASIHGTYRKVEETVPAIELIGGYLKEKKVGHCRWYFDSPVSNSGRLKMLIGELAEKKGWDWKVELSINPDAELKDSDRIIVSSDSVVLDRSVRWLNLSRLIISEKLAKSWLISLVGEI